MSKKDLQEIVSTKGVSNKKMFSFGAFGNEGVVLRREYVESLELRIEKLEKITEAIKNMEMSRWGKAFEEESI